MYRLNSVMPNKKCMYKEQMEWADSIASMDKIRINKDSAVSMEQI